MQNKMISLAVILLTSAAFVAMPVSAQTTDQDVRPTSVVQATKEESVAAKTTPSTVKPALSEEKKKEWAAKRAAMAAKAAPSTVKPALSADIKPAQQQEEATLSKREGQPAARAELTQAAVKAENKRRLEEELKNTTISGKSIVDFPNRPSLGSLELAPLPGLNDVTVRGPAPMEASVSGKDLPSEQLLGRITPEVFQEMADLERGNTFLKLQLEKEKLKNDLEKLKATYRQQRLDEVAKRENVVRSRIQWWQEQEKLRLAIEKKQAEEDALARKIAEQEAAREKIREEALKHISSPQAPVKEATRKPTEKRPSIVAQPVMEELYTLNSIQGIGQKLTAKITSKSDGSVLTVKKDDILPSGHVVKEIKKDSLTVAFGNRIDQLIFRPISK